MSGEWVRELAAVGSVDISVSLLSGAQFFAFLSCFSSFNCFINLGRSLGSAFRLVVGWCFPWGRAGRLAVITPISSWQLPNLLFNLDCLSPDICQVCCDAHTRVRAAPAV